MIEATCGACGTVARIAETDVPVGAKFVTCASCKSRVPLPQQAAPAAKKPPPTPAKGVGIPPAIPRPAIPAPKAQELADLPAPKRNSPLAGAPPSAPAPRSALGGGADLPAPKSATKPAAPSALDLDELMGADLPAPKPRTSALSDAPASKPVPSALADLPAPKAKPSALADLPAPKAKPSALADLPAPKGKGPDITDLPAPKGITDLPAPKGRGGLDLDNLPAPKGARPLDDDLDLPMPKAGGGGFSDLPMPKPGANNDLPAPKGFFDDLPQPSKKSGGIDLPAPKGFFDDLPQPSANKPTVDLPAPKGFFDDLPQPAKAAAPATASGGGFFDDLPQPPKGGAKPAATGGGLFDDLAPPGGVAATGGPNELSFSDIELGSTTDKPLELDMGPGGGGAPDLDLGLPLGQDAAFADLDLSEPTAKGGSKAIAPPGEPTEGSPIKIKTPKGGKPAAPIPITVKKDDKADLKLDLADDPHQGKPGGAAATAGKGTKKKATPEQSAEERAAKRKRSRIMLAGVLGVALLGAGGFYFYQKHAKAQERAETIASGLDTARKALVAGDKNHWRKAYTAAKDVLELDANNVSALGLAGEAAIAGALDNGENYDNRIKDGRKLVQQGVGVGRTVPELERAKAVMAIAANQIDRAIPQLQAQIGANGKNGWLQLYMGWAQLAKGDADAALKAFDAAVASEAATKLPALYGHGQARLMKADIEGARTDFTSVLAIDKEHIGAQVGLAATLPPQQSAQREADLLAILNIPDIDKKGDPRAVVKAWVLVGDVARNSGRLDIARERYRKAIAITALDIGALTGLANVELREGKNQVARDLINKALSADANNAEAQLLDATADIFEGKLPEAEGKIAKLFDRKPPPPPLLLARIHVAKGRLLEAQGKDEEAINAYGEGAKLAGDLDLTPTMAAVSKLTEMQKKATDEASAAGYGARAEQLLSALAEKAKEDGEIALALGVAYLQAGNPNKAEDMLRRAVAMREKDPESRLQLARALSALNRIDDAIASLKEALAIDPKRIDVALELARVYQNAGRDAEAMAAYEKLLAEKDVPLVVRANAGRYFANKGAFDKAASQAEPILSVEPDNQSGLYLKGEGQIIDKKWEPARITLTRATDADSSDAQALDALGRAFDGSWEATRTATTPKGEIKLVEGARFAYERATKADPKMFHPHLGLGRAYNEQAHYDEAIKPLSTAISLDKSNSSVMYEMGRAYYGLRNKDAKYKKVATQWFEDALRSKPELSLEQRAEANFRLGDLYFDLNNPPKSAAGFEAATKEGEDLEKTTGTAPEWLTETYYRLGQVYEGMRSSAQQKRAWDRYILRNPKPSDRRKAAEYWLNTTGKNFP